MSTTAGTDYYAYARTATAQAAATSTQSWKSNRGAGATLPNTSLSTAQTSFHAQISQSGEEPRTAGRPVTIARGFHEDLSKGASREARPASFATALSMADETPATKPTEDEFSFDDVIDIINPLHHLPVVNMIYREITGDMIKPMAQIIGGGIFGGPVGAVSGTVNAVVQETTGKDIAGNVVALVVGEDGVATPNAAPAAIDRDNPEMALSVASAQYTDEDYVPLPTAGEQPMPHTAMGFASARATQAYERTAIAEGRTAGWGARAIEQPALDVDFSTAEIGVDNLPPREAITVLPMGNNPIYGGIY